MKTKFKILIVCCLVATLLCSLCIFPSAEAEARAVPDTVIEAGAYIFNDILTYPDFQAYDEYPSFTSDGLFYDMLYFYIDDEDFGMVYENTTTGEAVDAYATPSPGWFGEPFRIIVIEEDYTEESQGFSYWFKANTKAYIPPEEEPFSIYDGFYDLIVEYVYGAPAELDTTQKLCATFFATCGSFTFVALPLVLVVWIAKFLLSMIVRI